MIARLVISPSIDKIREEITKQLTFHIGSVNRERTRNVHHPDILYFTAGDKLGIAQVRKIKEHFSLKPYSAKARGVVLEDAGLLTVEAQNALLKTLEELPKEAILILGANSDANLLPTILSRCQIIRLDATDSAGLQPAWEVYAENLEKLLNSTSGERFEYVEKLKDREEFLHYLVYAFREMLYAPRPRLGRLAVINFLKELLETEEQVKQNVNIRAILEYLMLVMPKISRK